MGGIFTNPAPNAPYPQGAFAPSLGNTGWGYVGTGVSGYGLQFDASRVSLVYTNNGHVYPLSLALNYIIKA